MRKITIICLLTSLLTISCEKDLSVPTFVAHDYQSVISVRYTSADVNTTVDPSYLVYQHRFVYSENPNMENAGSVDVQFNRDSTTTSYVSGLKAGTTYYYQYVTSGSINSHCSTMGSFTTLEYTIPTAETHPATSISANAFIANGKALSDGGQAITEKGFCYSTNAEPTLNDKKATSVVVGTGAYSCLITNLQPHTTYWVRAYAVNAIGVGYGEPIQLTTLD